MIRIAVRPATKLRLRPAVARRHGTAAGTGLQSVPWRHQQRQALVLDNDKFIFMGDYYIYLRNMSR